MLKPISAEDLANQARPVVEDYIPSETVFAITRQLTAVTFSGPSGAGKDTLINGIAFIELGDGTKILNPDYHKVKGFTSRDPRFEKGHLERSGEAGHYRFYHDRRRDALGLVVAGSLVQVTFGPGDHLYGTEPEDFSTGKVNLMDSMAPEVVKMADQELFGRHTALYVTPNDYRTLLSRQQTRGELSDDQLIDRLIEAQESLEIGLEDERFVFILNAVLDEAVDDVHLALDDGHYSPRRNVEVKNIAARVLKELRDDLGEPVMV